MICLKLLGPKKKKKISQSLQVGSVYILVSSVSVLSIFNSQLEVYNSALAFTSGLWSLIVSRGVWTWTFSDLFWECVQPWPSRFPGICGAFQSPYSPKHFTPQPFFPSFSVYYLLQLCILSQGTRTNAFTLECFLQMPNSSLKECQIERKMIVSSKRYLKMKAIY